tara:strand:- start:14768 stop:15091 length:324 start_codon:yes stop_codon:yes gene_type:complete
MTDRLNELARAITEAEDALNESNHRDDCQQLAQMDETRSHLVERIDAREKALDDAREAMAAHWDAKASEGAVKVPVETVSDASVWQVAEAGPFVSSYSNGLDAHNEE